MEQNWSEECEGYFYHNATDQDPQDLASLSRPELHYMADEANSGQGEWHMEVEHDDPNATYDAIGVKESLGDVGKILEIHENPKGRFAVKFRINMSTRQGQLTRAAMKNGKLLCLSLGHDVTIDPSTGKVLQKQGKHIALCAKGARPCTWVYKYSNKKGPISGDPIQPQKMATEVPSVLGKRSTESVTSPVAEAPPSTSSTPAQPNAAPAPVEDIDTNFPAFLAALHGKPMTEEILQQFLHHDTKLNQKVQATIRQYDAERKTLEEKLAEAEKESSTNKDMLKKAHSQLLFQFLNFLKSKQKAKQFSDEAEAKKAKEADDMEISQMVNEFSAEPKLQALMFRASDKFGLFAAPAEESTSMAANPLLQSESFRRSMQSWHDAQRQPETVWRTQMPTSSLSAPVFQPPAITIPINASAATSSSIPQQVPQPRLTSAFAAAADKWLKTNDNLLGEGIYKDGKTGNLMIGKQPVADGRYALANAKKY